VTTGAIVASLEEVLDGQDAQPAPALRHINRLAVDVHERIVYLGEIEEGDGEWFAQAVNHLDGVPGPLRTIEVWLNTPGGDVTAMFAIHDIIRSHPNIRIHAYGQVCSAGVLLLACGHRRAVTESCVLMSHENRLGGDEEGLGLRAAKDRRKYEDWQHAWWCELMARYTPKDSAWWKRTTERQGEYWLLGGAAIVEAGLADEVVR
jgi:ATP-dependent Clp protease protease subunit